MSLEVLMKWAGKEFTREDLFLMEAGSNSFEIARRLAALGLRAVVMESAYVGKRAKDYEDNDKMAAARIALVFLAGGAPCVWQPDPITCERRELLHAYQKAVNDNTAQSNYSKGISTSSASGLAAGGCIWSEPSNGFSISAISANGRRCNWCCLPATSATSPTKLRGARVCCA